MLRQCCCGCSLGTGTIIIGLIEAVSIPVVYVCGHTECNHLMIQNNKIVAEKQKKLKNRRNCHLDQYKKWEGEDYSFLFFSINYNYTRQLFIIFIIYSPRESVQSTSHIQFFPGHFNINLPSVFASLILPPLFLTFSFNNV